MSKKIHPMLSLTLRILSIHFMGITVFFLALMAVAMLSSEDTLQGSFYTTIPSLAVFLVLLYIEVWREAQRDYNRELYDRIKKDPMRGMLAAAWTQGIPLVIAVILCTPLEGYWPRLIFKLFYLPFYAFVNIVEASFPAVYFAPVIITSGVIIAAYALGFRGVRILDKIIYVSKKADSTKEPREKLR